MKMDMYCDNTYLFGIAGILFLIAGILWIVGSTMELTTTSTDDERKSKSAISMAANVLFLIGSVVLTYKGWCVSGSSMSTASAGGPVFAPNAY